MTQQEMGRLLRRLRRMSGYSVKEVSEKLKLYDIDIAAKTIYGYERGSNFPNINTFIALCRLYKFENLKLVCSLPSIDSHEVALLNKYRGLDEKSKAFVDVLLDYELLRQEEVDDLNQKLEEALKNRKK